MYVHAFYCLIIALQDTPFILLSIYVAGSLLLARNGVCVIGDVTLHKKDTRETLQKGT